MWILSTLVERCVSYTGDFCKPIGYTETTTVLFRQNVKDSITEMELELRGGLHSVQNDQLSPGCELAVLELLCYGALPICLGDSKTWNLMHSLIVFCCVQFLMLTMRGLRAVQA